MAASTGLIGFLPTHGQAGILAPISLGVLRLVQNFFCAGENTGGALSILEKLKEKAQNLWSSIFDASGILGILIASAATAFFQDSWRLLFWAGSLTAITGAIVRLGEKENYEPVKKSPPVFQILWAYKQSVASIAAVAGFSYANYYLLTNFMNGFLPLSSSITASQAMQANTLLLVGDFLLLPLFGVLAMKFGKEKLMLAALIASISLTIPLMSFLKDCSPQTAIGVRLCFTCIGVALAAPFNAWAMQAAPKNHRYLVGAFATTLGAKLIGAPLPATALWLYQKTGWIEITALPVVASALVALIFFIKKPVFALEDIYSNQ
jgi:MHS family proline/betaine transporter-like MFS transporter